MEIPETGAVFTLGKSFLSDTIGTVRHRLAVQQQLQPIRQQQNATDDETPQRQNSSSTASSGTAMVTSVVNGIGDDHANKPEPECNGGLSPSGKSPQRQQQSYFFIKNDPVVKIVCGNKQSAVICESGRLFVWGQNQYSQLGIASIDLCQKPSCVRTLKRLKQRVRDVRFGGNGYGLILTEQGKILYTGKNVFPFNAKVASLYESNSLRKCSTDNSEYTTTPIDLVEFSECLEKEDELLVGIAAGFCHFVVLSSAGNCFGWGHNSHQQLGGVDSLKILTKPDRIGVEERVVLVECGNYCTLMVSETNKLYLAGKFQKITIPVVKELSMIELPTAVISLQITRNDLIYLLLENNQVYRCNRIQKIDDLQFARLELFDQFLRGGEWITQIAPADNFTSFATNQGRLLTTYDDDSPFTPSDHFRELLKFKDFHVATVASGLEHSLVLAFPRHVEAPPEIEIDFCEAVESIEAAISSEEEKARHATPMPPPRIELDDEFIREEKRRLRQEKIAKELSKDECIQIETGVPEVRFIDNGVDMTPMMVVSDDSTLGEHMINEKICLDPKYASHSEIMRDNLLHLKTPTPNISQLIDYSDDENGSISSQSTFNDEDEITDSYTPAKNGKNQVAMEDSNNNQEDDRKLSVESKSSQGSTTSRTKMKQFLRGLKAKSMDVSCRNAGTVLNDDKHYSKDDQDIRPDNRPPKVCSLM
ncbi:uncharacterized protein LOC134211413 isoform X2 [Armigeres subalbatus]|uniref:uncharacterized protein LOC134211413 isoform X2 n=1 Tax=Armigeres subalbatus TaxID=124917 RepID=UPI002ED439E1